MGRDEPLACAASQFPLLFVAIHVSIVVWYTFIHLSACISCIDIFIYCRNWNRETHVHAHLLAHNILRNSNMRSNLIVFALYFQANPAWFRREPVVGLESRKQAEKSHPADWTRRLFSGSCKRLGHAITWSLLDALHVACYSEISLRRFFSSLFFWDIAFRARRTE